MDENKSVEANEFFQRHQELLAEMNETRVPLVVVENGEIIATFKPHDDEEEQHPIFGYMKGSVTFLGDIVSPLDIDWGIYAD